MGIILNIDAKPASNPIFGGSIGGVFLRTDNVQYPIFRNLYEAAFGKFWTVKMIDFSKDSIGFSTISPVAQRMFKLNNGYQALMDSGVVNVYNLLLTHVTNPELAILYSYISQNESIHAMSYSEGLLEMFGAQATEVIDIVYLDPIVRTRLTSEVNYSEELCNNVTSEAIFKLVVATYLLEHIKFPFSFFVTFSINKAYKGAINGFSMLLKKIAEDELDIHVPTNANVIKIMIREGLVDRDWATDFITNEAQQVLTSELAWNQYLQQEGSIPGYTLSIGEEFIIYQHNKALRDLGFDIAAIKPNDTVKWFNEYRNIANQVVAQQEQKSNSYQKGVLRNDLHKFSTGGFNV